MKQKIVFSLILVLAFSIVLVPMVNASCQELKYDDGALDSQIGMPDPSQASVKFSLRQMAKLVRARFYISEYPNDFEVHVYDLGGNDLVQPFIVTPTSTGWFDVSLNVMVLGDFFIAIEWLDNPNNEPRLGYDNTLSQGHSYTRSQSTDPWSPEGANWMIRAVVCEPAVGGELLPNTVSAFGSWFITGILAIALTTGIAYKKKKLI